MRLDFLFGGIAAGLTVLAVTNPNNHSEYARNIAVKSPEIFCVDPDGEICKAFGPLARPLVGGIVRIYTTSQNRIFFTTYHTEIPCLDIYGIGIVEQHIVWPVASDSDSCQLPDLSSIPW